MVSGRRLKMAPICAGNFQYDLFMMSNMNEIFIIKTFLKRAFKCLPNPLPLCFYFLLFCHASNAANLTTEVDRSIIGADETLQLTVRLDERVSFSGPDFSPLQQNFEIISQMRTNQFRNVNGRSESWTEWSFVLAPNREGQVILPSLSYEGAISDVITITVNPANQAANGEVPSVFIETKIDKDIAYVQEQILLSFSIHIAQSEGNLSDINMEELQLPDAVTELLSENTLRRNISGRSYYVKEIIFAIYPQQSTVLEIPSLLFALTTSRGNRGWNDQFRMNRGELRRLRSDAKTINIDPKPNSYSYNDWIPATNVTIEESWSDSPDTFKVGEPITRTVTLTAEGLTAAQLPPLPDQSSTSLKIYTDQPQQTDEKGPSGITGRRIESMAIVPTKAGTLTLPAVELGWWDTNTQQQRIARLSSRQISVASASITGANIAPAAIAPSNTSFPVETEALVVFVWPWMLATALCATLAIGFLIAWLQAKKQRRPTIDPQARQHATSVKNAADAVRRSCSNNDPLAAREALIQWAQLYWRDSRLTGLQTVANRSQHKGLARELDLLDKTLYRTNENNHWQGEALWKVLHNFRKQQHRNIKREALAPLYPV